MQHALKPVSYDQYVGYMLLRKQQTCLFARVCVPGWEIVYACSHLAVFVIVHYFELKKNMLLR